MRPYRWQDPAPAAVQAIQLRRLRREHEMQPGLSVLEWLDQQKQIDGATPDPAPVPSMVIEAVEYVEAPDIRTDKSTCEGCAFEKNDEGCDEAYRMSREVFGGPCSTHRVIYIRKA